MLYRWKVRSLKVPRFNLMWRNWRARRGDSVGNYNQLPGYIRKHAPLKSFADIGCMWRIDGGISFGDAAATLTRSAPFLPAIRALGYPAALVAQDGLEDLDVPWDDFDVLFIGGSTEWKLGPHARALAAEAKARGKGVHMGRVNSQRRRRKPRTVSSSRKP